MDYIKPKQVLEAMVEAGAAKAEASAAQMFVRAVLGGAILACATTLSFTAVTQTNIGIAGALIFPVGFVMIMLLGLELVTGSFALIPLAALHKRTTVRRMLSRFGWAIAGHLVGCLIYAALYVMVATKMGTDTGSPLAQMLISTAEAKTLTYKHLGGEGIVLAVVKAMLCNWMVALGAVMGMTSTSTFGKIAAMWLPILTFFGQGFEHIVVNMFVIPAGMMAGANVSFGDWMVWNMIPVIVGNFIGGALLTGLMLYWAHKGKKQPLPVMKQGVA